MSKSCKKATLFTVILTVILAAALVVSVMFGLNKGAAVGDNKSLTVSMDRIVYDTDMIDDVKAECEKVFNGASVQYEIDGDMDGYDREIVFVFDSEVDVVAMQNALRARFDELTKEGAQWYGYSFDVMGSEEVMVDFVTEGYVLRAAIAGAVFAVLALAYAWIRFKWTGGLVTALSVFFAITGTAAIVVLARIPVAASTLYAVMISAFFAVIAVLLNLNKVEAAKKAGEEKPCAVAKNATLGLCLISAAAILVAGGLSGTANLWFAVACVAGIVVAMFLGLAYAPAVNAALAPVAAAKEAAKDKFSYKGAKKTSTKVKKTVAAPVEETEEVKETPCSGCCASCEKEEVEEIVEETAEEVVEETAEEVVEETIEEVEAPVEEAVEEAEKVVEEATEEKAE